jgi:hypothetical protein
MVLGCILGDYFHMIVWSPCRASDSEKSRQNPSKLQLKSGADPTTLELTTATPAL